MSKDKRNLLELLESELEFVEKGNYQFKPPHEPTTIFRDSPTCLNYGYPYRVAPCSACHLLDFVPQDKRLEQIPCHHSPLNEAGDTVESLEPDGNEDKLEEALKLWLRTKIDELKKQ
jgi:hypothetical protein